MDNRLVDLVKKDYNRVAVQRDEDVVRSTGEGDESEARGNDKKQQAKGKYSFSY